MKYLFLTLTIIFMSGCSLIPKINFDTPNTVPQRVEKSKTKDVCKGKAQFNENGDIIFCSKGYYSYAQNYDKKERKMTLVERIKSFINNLVGWGFWLLVALVIFCPSAIGFVVGRLIEGVSGVSHQALKSVVRAIQKTRKTGKDINISLDAELDTDLKKHIAKIKDKENIK